MPKSFHTWKRAVFSLALVALVFVSHDARAQSAVSGTWTATLNNEKSDRIQLNFERRTERGDRSQTGMPFEFSDLQGLTREQALAGGAVRFSLVREAGRIDCEGTFQNGKGAGTFTFASNPGATAIASTAPVRGSSTIAVALFACQRAIVCFSTACAFA